MPPPAAGSDWMSPRSASDKSQIPPQPREGFKLSKWYLDCVAPDGRAVICYWASLEWGALSVNWQNASIYEPGKPEVSRSSLRQCPPPVVGGKGITWRVPELELHYQAASETQGFAARLLDTDAGTIDWRVESPASCVTVTLGPNESIRGSGYAERMSMTVLPWRVPIDELRWGRWVSDDGRDSIVWINWKGSLPRTWVFFNGVQQEGAIVEDDRIGAEGMHLGLARERTLSSTSLMDVLSGIPILARATPRTFAAMQQTRWCEKVSANSAPGVRRPGHAVHELVIFR